MNNIQGQFESLINLLERVKDENSIIAECLNKLNEELSFSYFEDNYDDNKEHLTEIYINNANIEKELRPNNHFVIGYDKLIPCLNNSKTRIININDISTFDCTYLIFTDNDYHEFIGILKSKCSLKEIRADMNNSKYYNENTFKNKRLIK